jgi:hypothetical protein
VIRLPPCVVKFKELVKAKFITWMKFLLGSMKLKIIQLIVLPGEKEYVEVTDNSSYARRYDMIACCNGDQVLPPIIFTPEDRQD